MTPPDSDDDREELLRQMECVSPEAAAEAAEIRRSMSKPDSDVCPVCGRLSVTSLGSCVPGTSIDTVCFRVKCGADTTCYPLGYERLAALVGIEPSLAQRILAALEDGAVGCVLTPSRLRGLRDELRAVIGK